MNLRGYDPDQPMAPGDALTGTPSCAVLVTSRDSLAGLVAMHGAHRIDLDLLPPADATTLLRTLIGPRVDADPDATCALIELCARLPLALRVAADMAISRPTVPLTDLVTELADQQRRLVRRGNTGNTPWTSSPASASTTPTTRRPTSRPSARASS